jgi:hypothetical protein
MFGRKGLGAAANRAQPVQAPRGFGNGAFPRELPQGERRETPRNDVFAPGEPVDHSARELARQLAEGLRQLRSTTDRLTAVAACPIGPLHLLPPELWEGRFGAPLLTELDLSPYRPWNTIFLPLEPEGAFELGLPVCPQRAEHDLAELEPMIETILDIHAGRTNAEGEGLAARLASVRQSHPHLFPPDRTDLTPDVRQARADVRALAFSHAIGSRLVDAEGIVISHETFLVDPETELTS